MAHILVVAIAAIGHVYYSRAMATELVRRGHRVTYLTSPDLAEAVESTGAEVAPYRSPLADINPAEVFARDDDGALAHTLFIEENEAVMRAAEKAFDGAPPDLVAYDTFPFIAGKLLASRWKVPAVRLWPNFADNEHYAYTHEVLVASGVTHPVEFPSVRAKLGDLLAEHGVSGSVRDFWFSHEDRNLVFIPREFQKAGETFDDRFRFVGPCLEDNPALGEWQPPAGDKPVVLMTLGTGMNDHPEFFKSCVDAFAGGPWHAVLTVGQWVDPAGLGPLPDNVEVHQFVPHMAVLEHAQVCVNHGGFGTVMQSLYWGRPMVVTPHSPDVVPVARRVADLGLGYLITPDELDAERLRRSVEQVATDDSVLRRVEEMSRAARQPGSARAADAIEAYLG